MHTWRKVLGVGSHGHYSAGAVPACRARVSGIHAQHVEHIAEVQSHCQHSEKYLMRL